MNSDQAVFYDPTIPMGFLDFGGCKVTCGNVPYRGNHRGREASAN